MSEQLKLHHLEAGTRIEAGEDSRRTGRGG